MELVHHVGGPYLLLDDAEEGRAASNSCCLRTASALLCVDESFSNRSLQMFSPLLIFSCLARMLRTGHRHASVSESTKRTCCIDSGMWVRHQQRPYVASLTEGTQTPRALVEGGKCTPHSLRQHCGRTGTDTWASPRPLFASEASRRTHHGQGPNQWHNARRRRATQSVRDPPMMIQREGVCVQQPQ